MTIEGSLVFNHNIQVCLLRNLPKVGVGVFARSGKNNSINRLIL